MANRKRNVQILLWVTPEEKKMIRKRMILSKTSNMSVYLRKMAIDGMIVNVDTTYLKKTSTSIVYLCHLFQILQFL